MAWVRTHPPENITLTVAVFNFNEVDLVTETTEDPRRPIPRIETPRRDTLILQSFLIHAFVLAILFRIESVDSVPVEPEAPPVERRAFLLPKSLAPKPPAPKPVEKVAPQPTPPPPVPVATPTPRPESAKISIGEASDKRAEVLKLERDRDIGRRAMKEPQEESRAQAAAQQSERASAQGRGDDGQRSGLPLRPAPPTGFQVPRSDDPRLAGPPGGLLDATERSVDRAMKERRDVSPMEVPGYQMGPLFFDPEGADFTRWINHFKGEVYRNWIIPEPARFGVRGQVGIEFTVERNGKISRLAMLSSSGMNALDRAASNALQGSGLLPLPEDYPARSVTMRVTFVY